MEGCKEEGKSLPRNDILLRIFVLTVVESRVAKQVTGLPGKIQLPLDENTATHTFCVCVLQLYSIVLVTSSTIAHTHIFTVQ